MMERRPAMTLTLLALLLLAGCTATAPAPDATSAAASSTATTTLSPSTPAPTTTTNASTTVPPALDERLAHLASTDDPASYAAAHDLPYEDGRVQVVIELRPDATLPDAPPVEVTQRHDALVEAWVAVDDLASLASADGVRYVRPPIRPEAVSTTEGQS